MRRGTASGATAVLVATSLSATGCSSNLGMPDPGSDQASEPLFLWRLTFWVAVALGGLVLALLAWTVVRHRAGGDDTLPRQHRGNVPLEITYTAIPVVIVAVLFTLSWRADTRTTALVDEPDVVVDVTGFQWQWRFEYVDEDVVVLGTRDERPQLMLPVGQVVRIRLTSADVVHSLFVPGFLTKRDALPGVVTEFDVTPSRPGTYRSHCAEFCGLEHAFMNFDVRVVEEERFASWIAERRASR